MMHLAGKHVAVIGAGVSGRAAARFLLERGARVCVYDDAPAERLPETAQELRARGAELHFGDRVLPDAACELAVLSPGIPDTAPALRRLRELRTAIVGELELASQFLAMPLIAITGTNGKTTVTELTGTILRDAGRKVFVGGNLGTPLVEAVGGDWEVVVAEASSFQLEAIAAFRPNVGVLLNVSPDHLDRHRDLATYALAKARVFRNQEATDAAVVNADDPAAWQAAAGAKSSLLGYSTRAPVSSGAWADGDTVHFQVPGVCDAAMPRGALALPGEHNLGNALAACLAAVLAGVPPQAAWHTARQFQGLPHRIEPFLEWNGIRFVDDSKATNVGAVIGALGAVAAPVVLVAGGQDKNSDFSPLAAKLQGTARGIVLVGAAAPAMAAVLAAAAPTQVAADWEEAVHLAVAAARPGDTVLLSPACASFDFFTGYAQRGEVFQQLCRDETSRREHPGN